MVLLGRNCGLAQDGDAASRRRFIERRIAPNVQENDEAPGSVALAGNEIGASLCLEGGRERSVDGGNVVLRATIMLMQVDRVAPVALSATPHKFEHWRS